MTENEKECPFCAEIIKAAAIVCRFCKSNIPSSAINDSLTEQPVNRSSEPDIQASPKMSQAPIIIMGSYDGKKFSLAVVAVVSALFGFAVISCPGINSAGRVPGMALILSGIGFAVMAIPSNKRGERKKKEEQLYSTIGISLITFVIVGSICIAVVSNQIDLSAQEKQQLAVDSQQLATYRDVLAELKGNSNPSVPNEHFIVASFAPADGDASVGTAQDLDAANARNQGNLGGTESKSSSTWDEATAACGKYLQSSMEQAQQGDYEAASQDAETCLNAAYRSGNPRLIESAKSCANSMRILAAKHRRGY